MKVLIAEYTASRDPTLAPEGKAMVSVLQESFERLGHTVVLPESGDFDAEIARLAPQCDYGLVIAPDEMLSKFTHTLELATHNIGSDSTSIAVCANKRLTGKILSGIGIAVPQEVGADYTGKRVIKPVKGAGSVGVRIAKEGEVPGDGEMAVEYLEGEHYSVSIVGSRVVGEACGYYSGLPPVFLTINRQYSSADENGVFTYRGGETPVHPEREEEIIDVAKKTIERLGCQGYVGIDLVVGEKIWVVDVNPRPTMSIIGVVGVIDEEIADVLLKATVGLPPEGVHYNGKKAVFDEVGGVTFS
ncbi:MAG TPA: ATP-grasp domain-containing protein [Methanocorpusculum sp.]|nr:ATP-grasp domain-containing protein [Candidatus Methanocorpusculum faecipullorum]HJK06050.1 ATP-grasp domain-containing protein [Methanocorpusculum sp.]HJK09774.1 ATP-grasp domain-containing protein [Methanocorpusculum sp.]HJK10697.1 ATP-grasp domain-containing protein [Methanocorpusculum sp.]HJK23928.1 ATP-grasp domain-containing protein [Methanocorpusculum sp.]